MARTRGAKAAATNSKSPQTKKSTRKVIAKPPARVPQKQSKKVQRNTPPPQRNTTKIFFNDAQKLNATSSRKPVINKPNKPQQVVTKAGAGRPNRPVVRAPVQRVNLGGRVGGAPVAAKQTGGRSLGVSLKTAEAIGKDNSHPNRAEVSELLKTFERGWIDAGKFTTLLAKYIA